MGRRRRCGELIESTERYGPKIRGKKRGGGFSKLQWEPIQCLEKLLGHQVTSLSLCPSLSPFLFYLSFTPLMLHNP